MPTFYCLQDTIFNKGDRSSCIVWKVFRVSGFQAKQILGWAVSGNQQNGELGKNNLFPISEENAFFFYLPL